MIAVVVGAWIACVGSDGAGGGGSALRRGADGAGEGADDVGTAATLPSSGASDADTGAAADALPAAERDTILVGRVGPERLDDAGTRKVFVRRPPGSLASGPLGPGAWFTELVVAEAPAPGGPWTEEVRVTGSPSPDRPAISPDGGTIAFVTGVSGLASVWIMPFEGGANPVQLTNVGLQGAKRAPGAPPDGFVPPPVAADGLAFDGDDLVWQGPSGPISVRWR